MTNSEAVAVASPTLAKISAQGNEFRENGVIGSLNLISHETLLFTSNQRR